MEREKGWLTSGAFAALCGATKETLRHYKNIGLLSPAHQGDNGYFYYDVEQFYDFYAISIFRRTGTPLEEIRRSLREQDASETLKRLREQKERLEAERRKLDHMDFVLSSALRGLEFNPGPDMAVQTAWFEREHLLALPVEELEGLTAPAAGEEERLIAVLDRCQALCGQYGIQADFQLGAIHLPGDRGGPGAISHLYTRIREKADIPYYREKPAGRYLYLCCRGRWDISAGYGALSRCVRERGVETTGGFYACDLAGFILNSVEKNAMSMISVRLSHESMPE
ncbi:MerR family transcriptional regulator [uncultured Oscillibacter sp.]|jgi:DNA-binding transcriptional MerR regulator|uniref:MerR family transcriptional regulator n=1 Tax=uncultured Oscillibacter sp. TaxID=876091 RepID=UPI0025D0B508|nr:MerR family transcriptional regulator [uncultured Oscillibacter sp.]